MAGDAQYSSITPSGIEINYYPPPDRHYEIRWDSKSERTAPAPRLSDIDAEFRTVPSVSEILDVLESKGLIWWGMQMGVEGVRTLIDRDIIAYVDSYTTEEIVALLTKHKLTVNHVRDKAGVRGSSVHDAFEIWATEGTLPDVGLFPEEEQGYVRGLVAFLHDVEPVPVQSEVMVASLEEGFAGRYDVRLEIGRKCEVVKKITPKRTHRAVLRPGTILADLKTSKYVYDKHHLQIEAYEGASIESGYGPSDHRGILHVTAEGRYEFVPSKANYVDFLAVKGAYEAMKRIKNYDRTKAD